MTVSLQGFLNALVYGWTRQDFVLEVKFGAQNVSAVSHRYIYHTFQYILCFASQNSTSVKPRGNGYQRLPATDSKSRTAIVDKEDFAQFSHSASNKYI